MSFLSSVLLSQSILDTVHLVLRSSYL
jgi:hypothetical protein